MKRGKPTPLRTPEMRSSSEWFFGMLVLAGVVGVVLAVMWWIWG